MPSNHKFDWIWITLRVVLAFSMPLALVVTLLAVGPYLGALLTSLLGGG